MVAAGRLPTSAKPRCQQKGRQVSCFDGRYQKRETRHQKSDAAVSLAEHRGGPERGCRGPWSSVEARCGDWRSQGEMCQTEFVSTSAPCQIVITRALCHPAEGGQYFTPIL